MATKKLPKDERGGSPQSAFTNGEVSPYLYGRIDFDGYYKGLRKARNFIVGKHGGLDNRPGTQFICYLDGEGPSNGGTILPYTEWDSCFQGVAYVDGEIWYVTEDHAAPTSTLYVIKYDSGQWYELYTSTRVNDDDTDVDGFSRSWTEPDFDIDSNGTLTVFAGLYLPDTVHDYFWQVDVFIFSGETLLHNVQIPYSGTGYSQIDVCTKLYRWVWIAANNYIHITLVTEDSGTYAIFDCISTDSGATFTPVKINLTDIGADLLNYGRFITEDSSGNLWVLAGENRLYKSVDHGSSWSLFSTAYPLTDTYDFKVCGDVFYAIGTYAGPKIRIIKSTNGSTWNTELDLSGSCLSAVLGYDDTYYYAIILSTVTSRGTRHFDVYRSSDGSSFTKIATAYDYSIGSSFAQQTIHLAITSGKMALTYYYAETLMDGATTVYFMTVWESIDNGETWTQIQTPFYDLSTGGTAPS